MTFEYRYYSRRQSENSKSLERPASRRALAACARYTCEGRKLVSEVGQRKLLSAVLSLPVNIQSKLVITDLDFEQDFGVL